MSDATGNPYGDEPYRTAWGLGFAAGADDPGREPDPPDFSTWGFHEEATAWVVQVWREGAAARRAAGAGAPGDLVEVPADLLAELHGFADRFPVLMGLASSAGADEWLRGVVGVAEIPDGTDGEG